MKAQHRGKEDEEVVSKESQARGSKPRRIYISKEGLSDARYGLTPGCRGCEAANRGEVGIHNEKCTSRIEGEIMKNDPGRYNRVLAKLVKHEDEESDKDAPHQQRQKRARI